MIWYIVNAYMKPSFLDLILFEKCIVFWDEKGKPATSIFFTHLNALDALKICEIKFLFYLSVGGIKTLY